VPDALVVVEEAQGVEVTLPDGFEETERRDYGETRVVFGRFVAANDGAA
jgi:16S rRNA (guanine966-N2)-methyltransferase